MKKLKPFLLVFGFLFALQTAFGHGVQIGYCVLDNGFIRVYIEHWHGDQTVQSLAGNTISVTTTYGSTTVTQNVNAAGAVNNTSWNNLPGCGASITILAQCPGEANNYNDWGYFDFAPAACGVPVSITINAGNTVVFAEACSQLYPQTITNTFNDTAPPVVTCPSNMSVTSCNATTVSYTATAVDACDPNPTVSYDIAPGSTFNLGTTTVTVTATDDQNQSSTCTFDVTVADDIPPTISCPSNIIEDTDPGICEDDPFFVATANDNCSATVTYSHAPGTYFPKGVTTVTATATDPAGNQASCSFTISVSDNEAPAITCPANITSSTDPGACDAVVDYTAPAGTDNCNGVTTARTDGLASGSAFPKGTTTVSYTATDASSNQTSCSFTVTVTDDEDPVITCPSNITVNTDANSCDAVVSYSSPSFADNCSGTTTALTSGLGSGSTFPLGTSTENWTATDAAGNTAICSFTITVEDNEAPNVVGQNITVQLDASGNASITPANVDGGTSDNCSFTLTVDKSSFGAADLGSNTVTLTATDPAGNSSSTTVTVTVEDLIPPTAVSQNITVSLDANGNAVITPADVDGGSYDNTPFTLTLDITSFGCSNTGPNTVTLTATDASSNTNSTTATVTVVDDIAPTAICQNVTVAVDANGDASITTTDVDNGSFDNCSFSLSLDNTSFNCADLGGNTVTLTATDASGNTGSCTATITVEDNILPSVTCKAYTAVLDANGQASITMSDVYDSGSDNCGTVDLVNVTPYSFDCGDVGANTVTLFVNDSHGNFNNCTATVTVADNSIPTVTCKNVTAQLDANGQASIVPADIFDSGDDNCGSANISLVSVSQGSFGCSDLGTQTVTLTVADANGNTATCTATVTVEDNVAPAAQCQDISVVLDVNSQASITVSQVNNGSSDACGTPSLALDVTSFDCDDLGANTVTLTATDASGNASSCTATVTVTENAPPVAMCQNPEIDLNSDGSYTLTPSDVDNGSSDACSSISMSVSPASFTCADIGVNTVTLTVTDDSGNSATCTSSVTINEFIVITSITVTHVSCPNYGDGSIIITAYSPTGQLEYSINDGQSYTLSGEFYYLAPGTYNIRVRALGAPACYVTDVAVVNPGDPANQLTWYKDVDGDGYSDGVSQIDCTQPVDFYLAANLTATSGDCDDNDPNAYPGQLYYEDLDGDGYGSGVWATACLPPPGCYAASQLTATTGDCNDSDASICPGVVEICNGIDDDCDGQIDEGASGGLTWNGSKTFVSQAQIDAFSQCYSKIQGNLTIQGTNITSLANLSNLEEVTGMVIIKFTSLSDLTGLDNLTTIGSTLMIQFNNFGAKLTSLDGLEALTSVGGSLMITTNLSLSDCCAIDDLLTNAGVAGAVIIYGNASGCDSVSAINTSCGGGSIIAPPVTGMPGVTGAEMFDVQRVAVFPNPAQHVANVEMSKSFYSGTLRLFSLQGKVLKSILLEENTMSYQLNLDDLNAGTYLLQVELDGENFSQRLMVK